MIEKPTLKTSVYLYLSFIEKNFSKIPTLLYSIQVAHFLKLYILMNQNLFEGFPQARFPSQVHIFLTQMVNILKGRGIDGTFTSFFLIIPVSISIILFLLAYSIMLLHPKKYQLDNHGRWNHVLKSTSSVLIFLSNFFIITFICMMIEVIFSLLSFSTPKDSLIIRTLSFSWSLSPALWLSLPFSAVGHGFSQGSFPLSFWCSMKPPALQKQSSAWHASAYFSSSRKRQSSYKSFINSCSSLLFLNCWGFSLATLFTKSTSYWSCRFSSLLSWQMFCQETSNFQVRV